MKLWPSNSLHRWAVLAHKPHRLTLNCTSYGSSDPISKFENTLNIFLDTPLNLQTRWPTVSRGGGILWRQPSRTACYRRRRRRRHDHHHNYNSRCALFAENCTFRHPACESLRNTLPQTLYNEMISGVLTKDMLHAHCRFGFSIPTCTVCYVEKKLHAVHLTMCKSKLYKNLAIANRSRYLTLNNIVTLKSGLEVTQCHWSWCHAKAWMLFPIRLL